MKWPLVVGLGSQHGDDQAGWLVLERLSRRDYPHDRLLRAKHPTQLLDVVEDEQSLVICDACIGNEAPGDIHCFSWPTEALSYQRPTGSHDLSLSHVLELCHRIHRGPQVASIWAIEGQFWLPESSPSNQIQLSAILVAEAIWTQASEG